MTARQTGAETPPRRDRGQERGARAPRGPAVLADPTGGTSPLRAFLLIVGVLAVLGAAGYGIGMLAGSPMPGLVLGVLLGAVVSILAYAFGERMALAAAGARPVAAEQEPRLQNVVEGLCRALGLSKPRLHIVPDAAPNAFSAGRGPTHASLAVTRGLLEGMNRLELEGVIAHELSHVRDGGVLPATFAAAIGMLVPIPLLAQLPRLALAKGREIEADAKAVATTRYPPGLASALRSISRSGSEMLRARSATAHLWLAAPAAGTRGVGVAGRVFATHPPIEERIRLLEEM